MRALFLVLALVACGDNTKPTPATPDDAPVVEPDAPPGALAPCLDQPTDLPRPPGTQLTCDLLPPGFSVPR